MGDIFDRLGRVVRSYLNDSDMDTSGRSYGNDDPDLADAWAELDDFLNEDSDTSSSTSSSRGFTRSVPDELRADFDVLNVAPGTSFPDIKQAYKKLMLAYHPDKHSGNPAAQKEATEMAKKVNAAFHRIKKWHEEEGL